MDKDFIQQIDEIGDLLSLNDLLDDDFLICECFCVSARDIRDLFHETRSIDLVALAEAYGMGQGCKSCLKRNDWVNKIF